VELDEQTGNILPDLTIGADVTGAEPLEANEDLANRGVCLFGKGFEVSPEKARALGLGEVDGLENHIRHYRNGRDLTQKSRDQMVIDLYGLEKEEVREHFPAVYQHVKQHVKPERKENNREWRRKHWWLFGEPNPKLRDMLEDLDRFIATPETAKHRFFQFLDATILPDNALVNIALDDAYHLGVLSSRIHVTWSLAAGGRLGVGNDPRYFKTQCFDPFPFPAATESQKVRIRDLGAQLDARRKERLDVHDDLTVTALYNVLKKERRALNQDGHKGPARTWTKRSARSMSRASSASSVNCTTTWTPPSPTRTRRNRCCDLRFQASRPV
jgi:hypothetical protein